MEAIAIRLEAVASRCSPPSQAHSKKGETPLMWAAKEQQVDCLKVLINARADLNAQDERTYHSHW